MVNQKKLPYKFKLLTLKDSCLRRFTQVVDVAVSQAGALIFSFHDIFIPKFDRAKIEGI